jgi:hypothetical protein
LDQTSGDIKNKSQQPENDEDNDNTPENTTHLNPLVVIVSWRRPRIARTLYAGCVPPLAGKVENPAQAATINRARYRPT